MIYIYKRHAGVGTEETFWEVDKLSDDDMWQLACEHAESYGIYFDEDAGEFLEDDEPVDYAECWLEGTASSRKELEEYLGYLLIGEDKEEELITQIEEKLGHKLP